MSAREELAARLVEHGDAASAEDADRMIVAYNQLPEETHDRLGRLVGLLRDMDRTQRETDRG